MNQVNQETQKVSKDTKILVGTIVLGIIAIISAIGLFVNPLHGRLDATNARFDKLDMKIDKVREDNNANIEKLEMKIDKVEERLHKLEIAVTAHIVGHPHAPGKSATAGAPTTDSQDSADPLAKDDEVVEGPPPPGRAPTSEESKPSTTETQQNLS